MHKKTLLSVAIASALSLTGCLSENNENPNNAQNDGTFTNPGSVDLVGFATASYPIFSPATGEFPTPNDMLIQSDNDDTSAIEQADGSFAIPGSDAADASPPVVALENLSGAALTSPIDVEIKVGAGKAIDESTVNGQSFVLTGVEASPVAPNGSQSVFLLELDYASGNPLAALSIGEAPTIPEAVTASTMALAASEDEAQQAAGLAAVAEIAAIAASPKYDAKVITRNKSDGSVGTYIRINPLQPLSPGKRYVVVLTDDIKTDDGASLTRHPGAAGYGALSDADVGLASTALAPVRSLINDLWEAVAQNYFAVPNAARAADAQLSEENIIFSISFTTTNDTKVVDYMVEPNTWITDTLASKVKTAAAGAAIAGGASSYDSIKTTVDATYGAWMANTVAPTNAALTEALTAMCPEESYPAGAAQFDCAGVVLEGVLSGPESGGGLGLTLPSPKADTTIEFSNQRNVRTVSAFVTDSYAPLANETTGAMRVAVNIAEGNMSIPYYSERPNERGVSDGSESTLINGWWKADSTIATAVDQLLRDPNNPTVPVLPQAVTTGTDYVQSNVVNSFYPFPVKNSDEEIPVLAVYPADDSNKPEGGYKTLIYQHGVTTDRSVALTLGSAIVANSGGTIAVLAIDQPLHGIDAISEQGKLDLAAAFLGAGQAAGLPESVAPGDANNQALVDGTLASTFVSTTLTASNYVAAALDTNALIDLSDGVQATESVMITETIKGNLSETFVAQTISAAIGGYDASDYPNNLTPTEQAVVTNMVAGNNITGNSDLNDLATQMPTLDAGSFAVLESLGGRLTVIQTDSDDAQTLVTSAFTNTLLKTYMAFELSLDPTNLSEGEGALLDAIIDGTAGAPYESAIALADAIEEGFVSVQSGGQGLALMQTTVANGASQIPGLGQGSAAERHFGFAGYAVTPTPMDFDEGTVGTSSSDNNTNTGSGALTINVKNFLTTRDNFRQGIVDMMTLRLSIPTMDLDNDGNADLDGNNVHFLAHSMGTLNGIPFVEIANNTNTTADDIVTANFLTPGGNIARLAENSPQFAPSILLGLQAAAGLERGDADLEAFLNTIQASLDAFDPINFVGGLRSTESTTKALFSEVVDDVVIPNNANPAADILQPATIYVEAVTDGVYSQTAITNPVAGTSFGEGTTGYLAGTSPLQTISGATSIDSSGTLGINFIRFNRTNDNGDVITSHGTPAAALTAEEGPSFAEFVGQATSMILSDGASIQVSNTDVIVDAD